MKTTRRGWLAALSGIIALPVLSKSKASSAPEPATGRGIVDHFAALAYPAASRIRAASGPGFWDEIPRIPLTMVDIDARRERLRNELHHMRVQGAGSWHTRHLESELRDLALARDILSFQPTGRPLTFHYSGGSSPHLSRTVLPTLVFHTEPSYTPDEDLLLEALPTSWQEPEPLYLLAYCLERLAPRTFRLDRITRLTPLS